MASKKPEAIWVMQDDELAVWALSGGAGSVDYEAGFAAIRMKTAIRSAEAALKTSEAIQKLAGHNEELKDCTARLAEAAVQSAAYASELAQYTKQSAAYASELAQYTKKMMEVASVSSEDTARLARYTKHLAFSTWAVALITLATQISLIWLAVHHMP